VKVCLGIKQQQDKQVKIETNMKVLISRVLNLDGTWQKYRLYPFNAHSKSTWHKPNEPFEFSSLNEIIDFYNLQNVRELGVKYNYDNKNQKYGIEEHEAVITLN